MFIEMTILWYNWITMTRSPFPPQTAGIAVIHVSCKVYFAWSFTISDLFLTKFHIKTLAESWSPTLLSWFFENWVIAVIMNIKWTQIDIKSSPFSFLVVHLTLPEYDLITRNRPFFPASEGQVDMVPLHHRGCKEQTLAMYTDIVSTKAHTT